MKTYPSPQTIPQESQDTILLLHKPWHITSECAPTLRIYIDTFSTPPAVLGYPVLYIVVHCIYRSIVIHIEGWSRSIDDSPSSRTPHLVLPSTNETDDLAKGTQAHVLIDFEAQPGCCGTEGGTLPRTETAGVPCPGDRGHKKGFRREKGSYRGTTGMMIARGGGGKSMSRRCGGRGCSRSALRGRQG